ncbi:tRNA (cytidine32/guanosine34-2'-O)-methyltransferase [Nematocida sp. AWRm80]|nr:tRNA (cytidine32/guanosine34-2'-O)-methyltransferase [Nematocida sp. AWRm80]
MERDIHYRSAKCAGYRARSAYKLLEIIEKYNILDNTTRIVDLCAAPGSWSQVLSHKRRPETKIVAVDLQHIEPIEGVEIVQGDITQDNTIEKIKILIDNQADLILCDGAPEVTGLHDLDEYFQSYLIKAACSLCSQILAPNGLFVTKVFTGESPKRLITDLNEYFTTVKIIKPMSSRLKSKEAFAICSIPKHINHSNI